MTDATEANEIVQVSDPLAIGNRVLFVVSRVISLKSTRGNTLFGALVSPIALIVLEADQYYAFSLVEEQEGEMDIDNLLRKLPPFREKIS